MESEVDTCRGDKTPQKKAKEKKGTDPKK